MNWFARYMIPGSYFVLYIAALFLIYGIPFNINKDAAIAIIGAAAFISLPVGYIISIISQTLYYEISKPYWVNFPSYEKAFFNKKRIDRPIIFLEREEFVEAWAAARGRLMIKETETDKRRWFAEWVAKRTDVLAINSSIMVATLIGYLLTLFLVFFIPSNDTREEKIFWIAILLFISFIIFLCLISSIRLLCEQIKHAHDALYDDLINSKKKEGNMLIT